MEARKNRFGKFYGVLCRNGNILVVVISSIKGNEEDTGGLFYF